MPIDAKTRIASSNSSLVDRTQVGWHDLKDFSFRPIMTIPYIAFDSMNMWVDEPNGKLYLVYDGQLVRLPLVQTPAAK